MPLAKCIVPSFKGDASAIFLLHFLLIGTPLAGWLLCYLRRNDGPVRSEIDPRPVVFSVSQRNRPELPAEWLMAKGNAVLQLKRGNGRS